MEVREIHQIYNSIYIDTNIGLIIFSTGIENTECKNNRNPTQKPMFSGDLTVI